MNGSRAIKNGRSAMKKNRMMNFIPIKEPVIYILYVKRERKWVVYYVGETTKSIRRLYDHSKDPDKIPIFTPSIY